MVENLDSRNIGSGNLVKQDDIFFGYKAPQCLIMSKRPAGSRLNSLRSSIAPTLLLAKKPEY